MSNNYNKMEPFIKELFEERDKLNNRIKEINTFIDSYKIVCKHEWVDYGNDSHYDYEICVKCHKIEKS